MEKSTINHLGHGIGVESSFGLQGPHVVPRVLLGDGELLLFDFPLQPSIRGHRRHALDCVAGKIGGRQGGTFGAGGAVH